jgi:hypothetical protein
MYIGNKGLWTIIVAMLDVEGGVTVFTVTVRFLPKPLLTGVPVMYLPLMVGQ